MPAGGALYPWDTQYGQHWFESIRPPTAWSNHSWSDIFISFSLQNRLKMRIIILGYFLWDVFDERWNRFLPGRGSFFSYNLLFSFNLNHS